ncbi:MAG: malonyl-CoA synthase [Rhodobacteraceae bacterium]|nr:malonyl-CoA synthase [Paracoccaceae bacterium]
MPNHLFDALFARHQGRSEPFLLLPGGGAIGYAEFLAETSRYAHALTDLGLSPGDRLAVQLEKSPHMLAVYVACLRAGVIFLPLNTAYTPHEASYFLENSGARLMLCDGARQADLKPISARLGARLMALNADGTGDFADHARDRSDGFENVGRGPDDLAAFLYTSGTTGRSKGAMLSHENLLSNAQALTELWQFTAEDVLLHALPIFHTHGLFVATHIALLAGAPMIFLPKFDADEVIDWMPRATSMMGVPTFYTRLLANPRFDRNAAAHMRLFVSGSAPLLEETHLAFEARTGHRILERYGMTETNMNTSNPVAGERRAGTVGLPLPGVELRIMDPETGQEVAPGEIGVIEVRGPNVFSGYWQMPEKTREELREDGFFITGDLGRMAADGYVTIVGRAKDLIITGGFNVYPKEVEQCLDALPGVAESAVIGVPHPDFGEGVVAIVVLTRDATLDPATLMSTAAAQLAAFKRPKRVMVRESLPRNSMGKVQKAALRERYADLFDA